jgi:hypothetical protein
MFAGCAILCNFIVISMETNARVRQEEADKNSNLYKDATHELLIHDYVNLAFLVLYSVECAIRLFIHGRTFFKHRWNVFDLIVVCFGLFGRVMETVLGHAGGTNVEHFQILRSIRMFRLLRAARIVISFKELYSLICGLSSCLKTLFWAAGLVFLLLTMWSILSVEYLHPLIRNLTEEGYYSDCSHCHHAFKDIMKANLTLFGIVSGGDWLELWRPVIERHPWTAVIIVCIIFTMVFGMLNLITAVIVDTAARAREADVLHMAKHKEFERQEAWAYFANLCLILDENHDGEISLQELQKGIREIPELSAQLSVLGVDDDDVQMVFDVLDSNQDGKITHKEFIRQLYKIQTYELRSAHCFMKHYVEDIRKHVKLLYDRSDAQLQSISNESLLSRSGSQSDRDLPSPPPQTEPVLCEEEQKGDNLVGEKLKVQSNSEELPILLGKTKHLVNPVGKSSCVAEEPFGPAGSIASLQTCAGNSSQSSFESPLESVSVNLVNAFACSASEPCKKIEQRSAETHSEQECKLSGQDLEAALQNDQEQDPQSTFIEPYFKASYVLGKGKILGQQQNTVLSCQELDAECHSTTSELV